MVEPPILYILLFVGDAFWLVPAGLLILSYYRFSGGGESKQAKEINDQEDCDVFDTATESSEEHYFLARVPRERYSIPPSIIMDRYLADCEIWQMQRRLLLQSPLEMYKQHLLIVRQNPSKYLPKEELASIADFQPEPALKRRSFKERMKLYFTRCSSTGDV